MDEEYQVETVVILLIDSIIYEGPAPLCWAIFPGEVVARLGGAITPRRARASRHRKRMPIVLVAAKEPGSETKMLARQAGVTERVFTTEEVSEVIGQIVCW